MMPFQSIEETEDQPGADGSKTAARASKLGETFTAQSSFRAPGCRGCDGAASVPGLRPRRWTN